MRRVTILFLIVCVSICACKDYGGRKYKDSGTENDEYKIEKLYESYVLNKNTKKFHYPSCASAKNIKENNREEFTGTRKEIINRGYSPCGNCKP